MTNRMKRMVEHLMAIEMSVTTEAHESGSGITDIIDELNIEAEKRDLVVRVKTY